MAAPILDLSTLAPERPFLTIDGERYELAMPDDFGFVELAHFERLMRECDELQTQGDEAIPVTQDVAARLSVVLSEATSLVLKAPPEVQSKLSDWHRLRVIEAFTPAVEAATPRTMTKGRRTSGRSSRASRASTAPPTG